MRRLLLAVALAAAALVVASVGLFVLRDDDEPTRADAVVVLAGAKSRLPTGLELVRRGVAPVLVISDGYDPTWWAANRLCRYERELDVLCPRPDPYSTRGEARMVGALARERGWDSVVVVSSGFHLFRAELLFERCLAGQVQTVAAPNPGWKLPWAIALEWPKLGLAALRRGC